MEYFSIKRVKTMINKSYEAQRSRAFESLSRYQQAELETFINGLIQGAVSFSEDNTFTVADLVGGKFSNWENTPLNYIYQFHCNRTGCENPVSEAGKDIGRIFKYIMAKDKHRKYELVGAVQRYYPINKYKMII